MSDEEPTADVVEQGDEKGKGNREAAKYRSQLREVEQERDQMRAMLTAARAEILTQRSQGTIHAASYALAFPDPDALFTADGSIDEAAVKARLKDARQEHPYIFESDSASRFMPSDSMTMSEHFNQRDFSSAFRPKDQ